MKLLKKVSATILSTVLLANCFMIQPVFGNSFENNIVELYNPYANENEETVNFEGIDYTYHYSYIDGNRTISITNNADNTIDVISYDESALTIYINGEIGGVLVADSIESQGFSARSSWKVVSSESYYVSWAKGVAVAVVAAAIAVCLPGLGAAGIIGAIGASSMSVLAAAAIGGTIYLTLRVMQIPYVAPQYQYEWRFKASTGTTYGSFYYVP